jgi:hypothetical protein
MMPRRTAVLTSFSLGLGVCGGIWIFLSLYGELRSAVVAAGLTPGLLAAIIAIANYRFRKGVRTEGRRDGWSWNALELVLGLILVLLAVAAFGPPYGDAVAFYMAWPKVVAASGLLAPLPGYEWFSTIWTVGEMHFAALMTLGGEPAAKFFIWIVVLACVGWVWELSTECGLERRGRLLATAMVLTSPAFGLVSWDGKSDLVAVAPALGAVWWTLQLRRPMHALAIVVTGCLAGTATAAKLSYLPPLGALLMVLVVWRYRVDERSIGRSMVGATAGAIGICVAAAITILPQIVKNQVLFAQPLAPMLIFDNGHVACCASANDVWYSPSVVRRIILTFPFAVSFGNYWAQYGVISPLVIGLLPFLMLWRPGGEPFRQLRWLSIGAVAGMVAWLAVAPSQMAPRYFLAPLLLFAILAAWLGQIASRESPRLLRHFVPLAAIALAIGTMPWIYGHVTEAAEYTSSQAAMPKQLSPIEEQRVADIVNMRARKGSRILLVSYYRYFFRPDLLQCLASGPVLDREDYLALRDFAPDDLRAVTNEVSQLKRVDGPVLWKLDIDLVVWEKALQPDFGVDPNVAHVIYENEHWVVYSVVPSDANEKTRRLRLCQPAGPGRWAVETRPPPA